MISFTWDWAIAEQVLPDLLNGLYYTLLVTLSSFVVALVLGLTWTLMRFAQWPPVSWPALLIVNFIRGTPLLIQTYFIFYILPIYGLTLPILFTGIMALGISYSAYLSEVFRGSIEAIRRGQWEACHALGLPLTYVWGRVILPQALRTATPMLGTYFILAFKDSAIVSVIGLSDLMQQGMDFGMQYFKFTEPLTMVAVIYFIISYAGAQLVKYLERRVHA